MAVLTVVTKQKMLKVAPWRWLVTGLAIIGLAGFFYVVPVRQMLAVADDPEVGKDGLDLGNFLDAGFEVKTSFTRADGRLFVVLQKGTITEWCDTSFAKEGAVISKTCVEPAGRYHPSDRPDPFAGMDLSQAPKPEEGKPSAADLPGGSAPLPSDKKDQ